MKGETFSLGGENLSMSDFDHLKQGSHLTKEVLFICFNENPLKMMKNTFYFILKALLVLKIFNFFFWLFGHVEEMAYLGR